MTSGMRLFDRMAETVAHASGIIQRQNDALERVEALHGVNRGPGQPVCLGCGQLYPCATIKALRGEA